MKIIGMMLARCEDWVLGLSARAALEWVDELVIVDHCSSDMTPRIISELSGLYPWKINLSRWNDAEKWDEMEMRDHALQLARKFGGTHAAIIDADEILTGNLIYSIRGWIAETVERFRFSIDVVDAAQAAEQTSIVGIVTGDFTGSPARVRYDFKLEQQKIVELKLGA